MRRHTKSSRSLRWIYDTAWNVIEDRDVGGEFRTRYVHGPRVDEILIRERSDGAKLCPLADGLGNTVALTNASGTVTQRFHYDAYGAPVVVNADYSLAATRYSLLNDHRFLFTGREWLGIAKLQDNRRRIFSASLGRWLTEDPLKFAAGDANLSRYVSNRVANVSDPSGSRLPMR